MGPQARHAFTARRQWARELRAVVLLALNFRPTNSKEVLNGTVLVPQRHYIARTPPQGRVLEVQQALFTPPLLPRPKVRTRRILPPPPVHFSPNVLRQCFVIP